MMHFKKHEWCHRQIFLKTLVNGMVAMAKNVGIDYLSVLNFFSLFEYYEKLLSNEHSFIMFVMKLKHYIYWGNLFMKNSDFR